jgi:predicted HicB family RNase H-like nuclease
MKHPYGLLLSVRIESEFKKKLKEAARGQQLSLSAFVKKLLTEGLAQGQQ